MDVTVVDATLPGEETARLLLSGVPSPVTLRDLIRFRVREEVARAECGDWEAQAAAALKAFAHNGFFVLVGDRQVEDLDAELTLDETGLVRFIRLVPLAGG